MSQNSRFVSQSRIRVLVADRNLLSAQLLAQALEQDPRFHISVVSSVPNLMSAGSNTHVAVLSADLGREMDETMRIARTFSERYPAVRLIILMDSLSRERVVDAFRSGASGVFCRTQPVADFLKCVDRVSEGEIWASRSEIDHLLSALRSTPASHIIGCEDINVLSKRELEVVKYASEGHNNKEIAEKLGLSEHTVKNYMFRAFEKIGVSSRVELLFYLLRQGKAFSDVMAADDRTQHRGAAEEGFPDAQLARGLAHYQGKGAEKDERSAYYWLRMAERNAQQILLQTRQVLEEVKKSMPADEIEEMEQQLAADKSGSRCFDVGNTSKGAVLWGA